MREIKKDGRLGTRTANKGSASRNSRSSRVQYRQEHLCLLHLPYHYGDTGDEHEHAPQTPPIPSTYRRCSFLFNGNAQSSFTATTWRLTFTYKNQQFWRDAYIRLIPLTTAAKFLFNIQHGATTAASPVSWSATSNTFECHLFDILEHQQPQPSADKLQLQQYCRERTAVHFLAEQFLSLAHFICSSYA